MRIFSIFILLMGVCFGQQTSPTTFYSNPSDPNYGKLVAPPAATFITANGIGTGTGTGTLTLIATGAATGTATGSGTLTLSLAGGAGNFTGSFTGPLIGNASTATTASALTGTITLGQVSGFGTNVSAILGQPANGANGFVSLDGSGNLNITSGKIEVQSALIVDASGNLYSSGVPSGQLLISGGSTLPISGLSLGSGVSAALGNAANTSGGVLTVGGGVYAPAAGSSSIVTVGTLSAGSIPYSLVTGGPTSLPPSGSAGGALNGTYPNPGVTSVGTGTYVPFLTGGVPSAATSAEIQSIIGAGVYAPALGPFVGQSSGTFTGIGTGTFTGPVNGVTLSTSGPSTAYLNETGSYSTPTSSGGTVTSVSTGNLSPLFTATFTNPTSTPALAFTISNAAQNSVYAGPASGGSGAPSFQTAPTISAANMTSFPTLNQNTTGTATHASSVPLSGVTGLGSNVSTALGNVANTINGIGTPATSGYQIPVAVFPSTPINFVNFGDSRTAGIGGNISGSTFDTTRCFTCDLRSLGIDNTGEPSGGGSGTNPNIILRASGLSAYGGLYPASNIWNLGLGAQITADGLAQYYGAEGVSLAVTWTNSTTATITSSLTPGSSNSIAYVVTATATNGSAILTNITYASGIIAPICVGETVASSASGFTTCAVTKVTNPVPFGVYANSSATIATAYTGTTGTITLYIYHLNQGAIVAGTGISSGATATWSGTTLTLTNGSSTNGTSSTTLFWGGNASNGNHITSTVTTYASAATTLTLPATAASLGIVTGMIAAGPGIVPNTVVTASGSTLTLISPSGASCPTTAAATSPTIDFCLPVFNARATGLYPEYYLGSAHQLSPSVTGYATAYFLDHYGINDTNVTSGIGVSAASTMTSKGSIYALAHGDGYTVISVTTMPCTTTAQFGFSNGSTVTVYNTLVGLERGQTIGGGGSNPDYIFDVASLFQAGANNASSIYTSGLWEYSGVHPSVYGHQLIAQFIAGQFFSQGILTQGGWMNTSSNNALTTTANNFSLTQVISSPGNAGADELVLNGGNVTINSGGGDSSQLTFNSAGGGTNGLFWGGGAGIVQSYNGGTLIITAGGSNPTNFSGTGTYTVNGPINAVGNLAVGGAITGATRLTLNNAAVNQLVVEANASGGQDGGATLYQTASAARQAYFGIFDPSSTFAGAGLAGNAGVNLLTSGVNFAITGSTGSTLLMFTQSTGKLATSGGFSGLTATGTNTQGADTVITSGIGTGTASSAGIELQVTTPTTTGTTTQVALNVLRANSDGSVLIGTGTTTLGGQGNLVFGISGAGILGGTTSTLPSAGIAGYTVTNVVGSGSAVSLTTATSANICDSGSLAAGHYLVSFQANVTSTAATMILGSPMQAGISTTSATLPSSDSVGSFPLALTVGSALNSIPVGSQEITLTSGGHIYGVENVTFTAGTESGYGKLTVIQLP